MAKEIIIELSATQVRALIREEAGALQTALYNQSPDRETLIFWCQELLRLAQSLPS
jgi:hypothetical protein